MTRKQIKDYMEDPTNWYTVPDKALVQVQMLGFGNVRYAAIVTQVILNITGIFLNHEELIYLRKIFLGRDNTLLSWL